MAKTDTIHEISRQHIKNNYDRLSSWYELLAWNSEKRFITLGIQKLGIFEGERILEIGSGTGNGVALLSRFAGQSGSVYGADISLGMCRTASKKMNTAVNANRVQLLCTDAVLLPFEASVFDALFMSFTIELFEHQYLPKLLKECYRVLKPSGRITIITLTDKNKPMVKLYKWLHKSFPTIIDCQPVIIKNYFEEAGFNIINSVEMSMWGLPVEIITIRKKSV